MEIEDIINYINDKGKYSNEIHIVGGLHPDKPFEYYLDMVRTIKATFKDKIVKAFTSVEIDYFSKISGRKVEDVLVSLKDSGLDCMPGGGAEIFSTETRNKICPEKIDGDRWLYIMEVAHQNGIKSNATMLYGHLESENDKLEHLERIRKLQKKTEGFLAFVALSFQTENTFMEGKFAATGVEDLKTIAVSRIILDNIPHIKAYWVMLGEKLAQLSLKFGADDLDGTIIKENISHAAGSKSKEGLNIDTLLDLIRSAGLVPVERDAFYNAIKVYQ